MIAKPKIYVTICGIPDAGKSTFIREFVKVLNNRDVPVDALCNEQIEEKTIRAATIVCRQDDFDIVLLDCPGHLEYKEEIHSCLSKCSFYIQLMNDEKPEESYEYQEVIRGIAILYKKNVGFTLHSHSNKKGEFNYNIGVNDKHVALMKMMADRIKATYSSIYIDPLFTARRIIKEAMSRAKNPVVMCSFGKDSLVLLALMKEMGYLDKITVMQSVNHLDMKGVSKEFILSVEKFFGISMKHFDIVSRDWTYDTHTVSEIMHAKALNFSGAIATGNYDYVFTGIRRDEEGTRSKEKFFSLRDSSGNADLYKSQLELFGREIDFAPTLQKGQHMRVSPLLDLTETDIWKLTKHYEVPVCSEYFSVNGLRYRSLGDAATTTPISSNAKTIDEIITEVDTTLIPERACRSKQDNDTKHAMEKIRCKGFF